jgi:curved DNA-binding protein
VRQLKSTKDFYQVLGIDRKATKEEIKKAHKKMAKKYHPDVNKSPEAEARFKEIQEAYEVLNNDDNRANYDAYGEHWQERANAQKAGYENFGSAGGGFDFGFNGQGQGGTYRSGRSQAGDSEYGDLFSQFFGGAGGQAGSGYFSAEDLFGGGMSNARSEQTDEEASLFLTLEEIVKGGKVRVQIQGRELGITLPASVSDGQRIRLKGMGRSAKDGTKGDLYVTLKFKPDPIYKVDGYDLEAQLQTAPWHAALGTEVQIRLPDKDKLNVKIPAGIGPGQKLRVAGKGLRKPDGAFGDLFVVIQIVVPRVSSEKAQQLYKELAEEQPFEPKLIG